MYIWLYYNTYTTSMVCVWSPPSGTSVRSVLSRQIKVPFTHPLNSLMDCSLIFRTTIIIILCSSQNYSTLLTCWFLYTKSLSLNEAKFMVTWTQQNTWKAPVKVHTYIIIRIHILPDRVIYLYHMHVCIGRFVKENATFQ